MCFLLFFKILWCSVRCWMWGPNWPMRIVLARLMPLTRCAIFYKKKVVISCILGIIKYLIIDCNYLVSAYFIYLPRLGWDYGGFSWGYCAFGCSIYISCVIYFVIYLKDILPEGRKYMWSQILVLGNEEQTGECLYNSRCIFHLYLL